MKTATEYNDARHTGFREEKINGADDSSRVKMYGVGFKRLVREGKIDGREDSNREQRCTALGLMRVS